MLVNNVRNRIEVRRVHNAGLIVHLIDTMRDVTYSLLPLPGNTAFIVTSGSR